MPRKILSHSIAARHGKRSEADLVVLESTYGDREHRSWEDTLAELGEVFREARRTAKAARHWDRLGYFQMQKSHAERIYSPERRPTVCMTRLVPAADVGAINQRT